MKRSSNPEWYTTLKEDQPLRKRMFNEKLATHIYKQALGEGDHSIRPRHWLKVFGAVAAAAALCAVFIFSDILAPDSAPAFPLIIGKSTVVLEPQIRDTLINSGRGDDEKKQVLLEKHIAGNFALIYSAPPKDADNTGVYIDVLKWTDYNGNYSTGTGLGGWSRDYSGQRTGTESSIMPGVVFDGQITYGNLNIFSGNLSQSGIAGIRIRDRLGNHWDADIIPSPDGSRYWLADTQNTGKGTTIEAIDGHGTVLSSYTLH
ncbi:hypothetical protein [Paenibacillus pinihumi]|uniref:hypothetical protein n=1 Tax=Paenibacillus pinihumi TaxID=669462 RepID=UPI0004101FC9|nr:hypothetical protein [Paenibacillus pinihumi]